MRIADNTISGNAGVAVTGVWLQESGTFVDDNDITGGCATTTATGVYSNDSFARIQNNRIRAGSCGGGGGGAAIFRGVHVITAAGVNEVDVHSNTIDGGGNPAACTSVGIDLDVDVAGAPVSGVGIFRNDVVLGGVCNTSYDVREANGAGDPRVFENVNLDPYASPTAIYYDADTGNVANAAGVNALGDMTVSNVLDLDTLFVGYPLDLHLGAGSPCDGTGTPTGAPATDMDGDVRDAANPDIGADERP
jgi:hypothetical protein